MPYLTDNAVCLRVTSFSETSQVVALFTETHGLVPMIAKGAKQQSKSGAGAFSGPLDLLAAGQVVFLPAKSGAELATLSAWQLTDQRNALRQNLAALNAACVAAEITLGVLHPHDPHAPLFAEFQAVLALLATEQRPRALVAYAISALDAAGYRPHLDVCAACGVALAIGEAYVYSPSAGGVLCAACRSAKPSQSIPVTGKIAIALHRLPSPTALVAAPPDRPADAAALHTALQLLLFHLESLRDRPMRTRSLLKGIFSTG